MTTTEVRHAVRLSGRDIGVLRQRGDHVVFTFLPEYWEDPDRHVLGLWFEDHPRSHVGSALRVPAWFSNLLPEGRLRDYIAADRGVSPQRDMEILAQVGHDLPGAVEVVDGEGLDLPWHDGRPETPPQGIDLPSGSVKFSLAGVGLKFSMRRQGERFTIPASGQGGGQWIVKLPDPEHRFVPQNEFAMMSLAKQVGIDVPDIHLVHRDDTFGLPEHVWPQGEELAYAVRRFDRGPDGARVHIEDLAQVRGFHADKKYAGTFETVAALCFRGTDIDSLHEFVRRMTFNLIIGNGDAHLKNWSLIYPDGRNPRISPAYDLVSTVPYNDQDDLGLKFGHGRRFEDVSLATFDRLARKLGLPDDHRLAELASATYAALASAWDPAEMSKEIGFVGSWIEKSIAGAAPRLR